MARRTAFISGVSTHSRLKAAAFRARLSGFYVIVSTHSRLKAAASNIQMSNKVTDSFNTQPPKGGCLLFATSTVGAIMFQHTAA